jgi:4-hydroxy-4-methyl-2-oxoglutarate aldolase
MSNHTSLHERLAKLDSCALSDALDRLGLNGSVLGLRSLAAQGGFSGRAITVEVGPVEPGAPATTGTPRHMCAAAVDSSGPGDVIVVSNGGRVDAACWGGILSLGAVVRGVSGVVIDGAPRDVDEAAELGLCVYGRAPVQRTARGRLRELTWNQSVSIAGVPVAPGDWVRADGSGVTVCPASRIEDILAIAEEISARERLMIQAVRAGASLSSTMGASYEALAGPHAH